MLSPLRAMLMQHKENKSCWNRSCEIADLAFQEERKVHTKEIAAAQHTIGALQHELRNANTHLDAQGVIV